MNYKEESLVINLIAQEYETSDPDFISRYIKDVFDLNISPSKVKDYFSLTEDYEKITHTIEMEEIFN